MQKAASCSLHCHSSRCQCMQGRIAKALNVGAQRQLTRHRSNSRRPRADSDNNLSPRTFTACLIDAGTAGAPDLQGIPIKAGMSRAPPEGHLGGITARRPCDAQADPGRRPSRTLKQKLRQARCSQTTALAPHHSTEAPRSGMQLHASTRHPMKPGGDVQRPCSADSRE